MIDIGLAYEKQTQKGPMYTTFIFPEITSIDLLHNNLLLFGLPQKQGVQGGPAYKICLAAKQQYNQAEQTQPQQQPQAQAQAQTAPPQQYQQQPQQQQYTQTQQYNPYAN